MFRNGYIYVRIRHMLRDKSNKRDRIRSNLLATLSKSGTAMAVPVATALSWSLNGLILSVNDLKCHEYGTVMLRISMVIYHTVQNIDRFEQFVKHFTIKIFLLFTCTIRQNFIYSSNFS